MWTDRPPDVLNTQRQETPLSASPTDYSGKNSPRPKITGTKNPALFFHLRQLPEVADLCSLHHHPIGSHSLWFFKDINSQNCLKKSVATLETLILASLPLRRLVKKLFKHRLFLLIKSSSCFFPFLFLASERWVTCLERYQVFCFTIHQSVVIRL